MHSPVISPAVRTGFLDLFSIGALLSGICLLAERRSGRDRRRASRGGRRAADGSPAVVTPPLQMS